MILSECQLTNIKQRRSAPNLNSSTQNNYKASLVTIRIKTKLNNKKIPQVYVTSSPNHKVIHQQYARNNQRSSARNNVWTLSALTRLHKLLVSETGKTGTPVFQVSATGRIKSFVKQPIKSQRSSLTYTKTAPICHRPTASVLISLADPNTRKTDGNK